MYDFNFQKHAFFGKLDGITNDYNNEYHSTIKIKLVDVKSSTYIDLNVEKKKLGTMQEHQNIDTFLKNVTR